jgi:hypothetical protein
MHRVYNSAFMNMLKNEHNDQYRSSIKNVLEFNPEILKRFVNFMNNPDEDTAVAQFGKGDKYFGVCTMMVTMPGLPMFGHGQIEGYTEKYGMEYRKAYWDEQVDQDLIQRHEREIFPVMRLRHLFSDVKNFCLYDFYTPDGHVNENVFAYSNSHEGQHGLVVYHNKFADTSGWINMSSAYSVKVNETDRKLEQKSLGQALGVHQQDNYFVIFREQISGQEFIRRSRELREQGLFISLNAYQTQVFINFREVEDNVWQQYANLEKYLNGRGVPNIEEALKEIFLMPLHQAFRQLMNRELFQKLFEQQQDRITGKADRKTLSTVSDRMTNLLQQVKHFGSGSGQPEKLSIKYSEYLQILLDIPILPKKADCSGVRQAQVTLKSVSKFYAGNRIHWYGLLALSMVKELGQVIRENEAAQQSRAALDEWLLQKIIIQNFYELGIPHEQVQELSHLMKVLVTHQNWWEVEVPEKRKAFTILEKLLKDEEVRSFLNVNRYREILWFNLERFEKLMQWLLSIAVLEIISTEEKRQVCEQVVTVYKIIQKIERARKKSDYQLEKLLEGLR